MKRDGVVLTIDLRHDMITEVHRTHDEAKESLYLWVQEHWEDGFSEGEIPTDRDEAIEAYFDGNDREGWSIVDVKLPPAVTETLPISRYLDLSTGHLPQAEMVALRNARDSEINPDQLPARVIPHAYGAWVNVQIDDPHEQDNAFAEHGQLPNLLKVVQFARAHDCTWVNFDRDAAIIDELPSWEW